MRLIYTLLFIILLITSCKEEEEPSQQVENLSDEFATCNRMLSACVNGNGEYCLFGYKWGSTFPLNSSGYNSLGPKESGGIVTFSFQEKKGLVNTHAQVNLTSQSFSTLPSCAKTEIIKAFDEWASVANIEFKEAPENSESDIKIFVANIRQSGVGYPNFPESPCNLIGGDIVIQNDVSITECNQFYKFMLHEIGHVLGLGHVQTQNIMNSDFSVFKELQGLQSGDIKGIIELYGEK